MKKGEKVIFGGIGLLVAGAVVYNALRSAHVEQADTEIPFYSTASKEIQTHANALIKSLDCRSCHALWTMREATQAVPAPALDGIGSLRSEQWLFDYLSAVKPQEILPSRLKAEYRMPSYASLSEAERRTLAAYLSSLKVKDWYLEEVKKDEYEKLTGNTYTPPDVQKHE